jgi:tRNA-2-methylthio-N6-dimethylallyladenosine synthase
LVATAPSSAGPSLSGRYHIETWGCQMNVHDSEKLAGILERQGLTRASGPSSADVILLNTCSIREKAAEKVFSELGRLRPYKRSNPDLILGVCGCVGQQEGQAIFARAPYVDLVIGPRATGSLPSMIASIRAGLPGARRAVDTEYRHDSIAFPFDEIRRVGECKAKAFVTVIEGCNHRCTYCIVPTTRGREICRDLDDVLAEVRQLAQRGVVEIEFLGQTVNAYRDTRGRTLADLLRLSAEVDGVQRIRFTTSHPAQMTETLMDAMAQATPCVCPYLHLPVQSGSSSVLRAMRRGYDREGYLTKIDGLRRRIPGLALGTDIIVGFPGEGEPEFAETMSLLEEIRFDTVYSFTYSERPGTAALDLGDPVPHEEKLARLARLQARQGEIQALNNREWIGREVTVLVEGPNKRHEGEWSGRTPENRVVHFKGQSAAGRLEPVRVVEATPYSLRAEPLGGFADSAPKAVYLPINTEIPGE